MKVRLVVLEGRNNIKEFCLVGLEFSEDFDVVVDVLINQFHAKMIDTLDGIWFKTARFKRDRVKFTLMYHDDLGTYLYSKHQKNNDYLNNLLEQAIPYISEKIPDA